MAEEAHDGLYGRIARRLGLIFTLIVLFALSLLWRIDNTRAERIRLAMFDQMLPISQFIYTPVVRAN